MNERHRKLINKTENRVEILPEFAEKLNSTELISS